MPEHLTAVETVRERGSWLWTAKMQTGETGEVVLLPCEDGVTAWVNRCPHEDQRLDRGEDVGVVTRDGDVVCPRHGSTFDTCEGACDNGPAAGSRLLAVEVSVNRGEVYLTDDDVEFLHEGGRETGDSPSSTSHLRF